MSVKFGASYCNGVPQDKEKNGVLQGWGGKSKGVS